MRLNRIALNGMVLLALGGPACSPEDEAPRAWAARSASEARTEATPPGAPLFSRSFPGGEAGPSELGEGRALRVTGLAADAASGVFLCGAFRGTVDFGRERLTSRGGKAEVFVAKLGPDGSPLWARHLAGVGRKDVSVAADSAGNAFVLGAFRGSVDFGSGPLTTEDRSEALFLLKLGPDGNTLRTQKISSEEGGASPYGAAATPAGGVVIVGYVDTDVAAGAVRLRGNGSFAFALDASGGVLWGQNFGRSGDSVPSGVAVDRDQNTVVAESHSVGYRFYLAKLDRSGATVWRNRFNAGRSGSIEPGGVAVDARGDILLTGAGGVDFGVPAAPGSEGEGFVARFDPGGAVRWVRRLPFAGTGHVAADAAGYALVAGASGSAVLLAKLSPQGDVLWTRRAEGSADAGGIALRPGGDGVVLAGTFRGRLDFGAGPLSSGARTDIFVTALAP
ncbi:hypothetical protein [Sorangium sp. So ce1182]|uniref:hypothetical protein n=1 Tax=Sorangium sp. So ce1182 TaxID=3133334 RepID=UPI003F611C45